MKITRKMLQIAIVVLAFLLIAYGLIRHFTDLDLGEDVDKYFSNGVIIAALALFLYNRKLFKDEKLAKEAAEQAKLREEQAVEEPLSPEDEKLPHWERGAKREAEEEEGEVSEEE